MATSKLFKVIVPILLGLVCASLTVDGARDLRARDNEDHVDGLHKPPRAPISAGTPGQLHAPPPQQLLDVELLQKPPTPPISKGKPGQIHAPPPSKLLDVELLQKPPTPPISQGKPGHIHVPPPAQLLDVDGLITIDYAPTKPSPSIHHGSPPPHLPDVELRLKKPPRPLVSKGTPSRHHGFHHHAPPPPPPQLLDVEGLITIDYAGTKPSPGQHHGFAPPHLPN